MEPTESKQLDDLLEQGLEHHRHKRLAEAEGCYRKVIAARPWDADATNFLGAIASDVGQLAAAEQLFLHALTLQPHSPATLTNLGSLYKKTDRPDAAIDAFQKAIALDPNYADPHLNLGTLFWDNGRIVEAEDEYRRALAINPTFQQAAVTLGDMLRARERAPAAVDVYAAFLRLDPRNVPVLVGLGRALTTLEKYAEANQVFLRAQQLDPTDAIALVAAGIAFEAQQRPEDAMTVYQRALVATDGKSAIAQCSVANILKGWGHHDLAINAYRAAMEVDPQYHMVHSNLLFSMLSHHAYGPKELAAEHAAWNRDRAEPLKIHHRPHTNDPDPDRKIRMGFVSADYFDHTLGVQLLPLMGLFDRSQFEIGCYSQVSKPDKFTAKFKSAADFWRDINGVPDPPVVEMIRADQTDILIDLAVHTGDHRLTVFARKPAPVQVTYLGYCGTTGLTAIDYRISDPYFDPPGTDLSNYSEKTILLDKSYWAYRRPDVTAPPADAPFLTSGHITFGCLNAFTKVSPPVLELWRRIILAVPDSRLLLHAKPGRQRESTAQQFVAAGIDPMRIEFVGTQSGPDYLKTYNRIDIALDPFPYAGGITSCDCLWMGTPMVTLNGKQSPVSRGGVSILRNLGLPELVAENTGEYFSIATRLAADRRRVAEYHRTIRERMEKSPLMDAAGLVQNMERIFRRIWQDWCRQQRP